MDQKQKLQDEIKRIKAEIGRLKEMQKKKQKELSSIADKQREKKLKQAIQSIASICGYKIVSYTIGKSKADTLVTFINTRLRQHTTTLRALEQRDKNSFSTQERFEICKMFEELGYRNFFEYPNDMEQWCKSLCDCVGCEFESIELSKHKSDTRVFYKGGTNRVTSLLDKMYRKGRRMINEAQC